MIIGKMRHKVELQSATASQNECGEESKVWNTDEYVFAQVEPLRGQQLLEYQQINAELTHRIIIRYTANATAENRIKWGSRIFDISAPPRNIEERNIYQELLCKEKL